MLHFLASNAGTIVLSAVLALPLTYFIFKDVEGVRGYISVNMVGNQLKIGFAATDGTNVQYAYERTE